MTEEYKKKKMAYIAKYQREFYSTYSFKIRTKEDRDIIEILDSVPNKSEFIKKLIRDSKKQD